MSARSILRLAIAAASFCPFAAGARELVLDYPTALALAVTRAPELVAARGEVAVASGERRIPLLANPRVEVELGRRETHTELAVAVDQPLALGHGARVAGAEAALAGSRARAEELRRRVRKAAALAFLRAVFAEESLALAQKDAARSEALSVASERRLARGDATPLDTQLARAASGRTRAAVRAAEAERELALGELAAITGIDPDTTLRVKGDLAPHPVPPLGELLDELRRGPARQALIEERRRAEAQVRLGRALAWPELTVGASYAREGDEEIWLGRLGVGLPLFERGQQVRARGRAEVAAATEGLAARARDEEVRLRAAHRAQAQRALAVAELDEAALAETEALLARAYELGKLTLVEHIAALRELEQIRLAALEHRYALAVAVVELEAVRP